MEPRKNLALTARSEEIHQAGIILFVIGKEPIQDVNWDDIRGNHDDVSTIMESSWGGSLRRPEIIIHDPEAIKA